MNVQHLFIVLIIFFFASAPLYLKNWYTLATVFLLNNLQPNCSVWNLPDMSLAIMLPPLPDLEIFKVSVRTKGVFQETVLWVSYHLQERSKVYWKCFMGSSKHSSAFLSLCSSFALVKPTTASAMVAIKILGLFGHIYSPFLAFPLAPLSNAWTPHHRDWAQFK